MIRRRRREVSGEQILCHRQAVLRIRRHLVAPLVARMDAVVTHQPFDPFLASREASGTQLTNHVRTAIGALEFCMNGPNERQYLAVGQSPTVRPAAALPGTIAADADIKQVAHFCQRKLLALLGNPGVLHLALTLAIFVWAFVMTYIVDDKLQDWLERCAWGKLHRQRYGEYSLEGGELNKVVAG